MERIKGLFDIEPNHFKLVIIGLIVFIIFLFASDLERRKKNKENFNDNPKVWGIIENVRIVETRFLNDHTKTTYADISYSVKRKNYHKDFVYRDATEDMIGQKIIVAYEKDDPKKAYIDIYGSDSLPGMLNEEKYSILWVFVGIAIYSGIYFLRRFFKGNKKSV